SLQSQNEIEQPIYLTEDINKWLENTWVKYNVNIWAFASDYMSRFYDNDSLWPTEHKIRTMDKWEPYIYDYKQKSNLFNLNMLYPRISGKPFIKGKKQYLEVIMMYIWLDSIVGDEENYWEEYFTKTVKVLGKL
ncbi:hypothetical protein J9303_20045, partial [Bacillaceae bacterium Marseille-Q3522]|nr:hypothetical protein [Bacillaceae bacterium Marseille-Q3522]